MKKSSTIFSLTEQDPGECRLDIEESYDEMMTTDELNLLASERLHTMKVNRNSAVFTKVIYFLLILILIMNTVSALAAEDRLTVAYSIDFVPFHYQDHNGQPAGMIIDYWRLWSEKTGIPVDFVGAPWDEALKMVGSGAADAHAGLFYSKERDAYLDYGSALRQLETHVFFHNTISTTTNLRDLAAYRVGVVAGDLVEGWLKKRVPGGHIVGYQDYDRIIEAVQAGELRVIAADTPVFMYHLKRAGLLGDFSYVADSPLYRNDIFIAVQEGDATTLKKINQGMEKITQEESKSIVRHWSGPAEGSGKDDALIIAIDRSNSPSTFMNAQGRPAGLFIDIWQAWAEKSGRKIKFRSSNWLETLEALKAGEVDIHSGLSFSKQRAKEIGFSRQIYQTASRIYHLKEKRVPDDLGNFKEKVLGVQLGTWQETQVSQIYPELKVNPYVSNKEMVDALIDGNIDAILQEELLLDVLLRDMGLQGDVVSRPERLLVSTIHAGVVREQNELLTEIDRGFSLLTDQELAEIEARWIADPKRRFFGRIMRDDEVGLTPEERDWLNSHPVIRLGADRAWPPYEFLDEKGKHRGGGAVFLERIGEMLGISFKPPASLSWSEVIEMAKSGRLDVLSALAPTPERQEFFNFTKPYMDWPNVIAVRSDTKDVSKIEDLMGRKVSVVDGYGIHLTLAREHPDLNLVPQPDVSAGLIAISTGKIDAFVGAPGVIEHYIDELGLDNISLAAPTPYKLELAFGVRKDWPELAIILDKALGKISLDERIRMLKEAGLSAELNFAKPPSKDPALLKMGEKVILGLAILAVVVLLLFLIRLIRTQERPFLHGLQGKSMLFLGVIFLLIGGATLWALLFVGGRISTQLGHFIAERHVMWHKEKVLGAVQRELALSKQMAESELLIDWAQSEEDPAVYGKAREELQRYHDNFKARTYFVGLVESGHFFYADAKVDAVSLDVVDTLSPTDEDDVWFFTTIKDPAPYNLNVDHNVQLGVTNLWVNYALRRDGKTYGVVGTGIHLTDFIGAFIAQETRGVTAMMIDSGGSIQAHADPAKIAHNVLGKGHDESGGIWDLLESEEDRKKLRAHLDKLKKDESEAETFFLNLEGKRTLAAISYLAPLQWFTIALFEPDSMVGIEEMGTLAAVLALSLLITVILFVVGQNALIIQPLSRLTQGAKRLSAGDYDVRLPVEQRDEIGDLTDTFNNMAGTIADYTSNLEKMVEDRTRELSEAYGVITSSINYASRIQRAILPSVELLEQVTKEYFILWDPRDVVGGDIYWCHHWGEGTVLILADCTGHGVPGAFMTLISSGTLERALFDVPEGDSAALILRMHQLIQVVLGQDQIESEADDGLELGVCYIPPDKSTLTFAGAGFPLFIAENGEVSLIKGDRKGIGYRATPNDYSFSNHQVENYEGRVYYMTSDGLIDQIGGEKRRGFGKKRFMRNIVSLQNTPLNQQGNELSQILAEYQGGESRRDDIAVIGFEV